MKLTNLKSRIIFTFAAVAAFSSCGSNGVTDIQNTGAAQTDLQTPTVVPSLPGGFAPYNHYFETCGKEPKAVSGLVQTDNLLNIRVRAEAAPSNGCYSNANTVIPYQARYSCARFKVTMQVKAGPNANDPVDAAGDTWINRASFVTPPLAAPGTDGCQGSQQEVVYNLTNQLFPGHGLVRFQIESMDTDHMCNMYNYCKQSYFMGAGCQAYAYQNPAYLCPLKPTYQYHKTAGQIDVQTDVTVL